MTPKNVRFKMWVEGQAKVLRSKCRLPAFARLDPFELAREMKVDVFPPSHFLDMTPELLNTVTITYGDTWDAGTLTLPDNKHLVILNPARESVRQHTTLMEELAHIHLGHKPSRLVEVGGVTLRSWNQSNETQAYAVGSAALLPEYLLKGARTRGYTVEDVCDQHLVSSQLVTYRLNLNKLALLKKVAVCIE